MSIYVTVTGFGTAQGWISLGSVLAAIGGALVAWSAAPVTRRPHCG